MEAVAKKPKYLGHEVHFYDANFNREVAKYERFCTGMAPIVEELKRIGLSGLTSESLGKLVSGIYDPLLNELRTLAIRDADKVGFVFKPVYGDAVEKAVSSLMAYLNTNTNFLRSGWEFIDVPVVDGNPTLTDEFRQQLREKYTMRIRTERGSIFYEKFLAAQALIKEMIELGFPPEAAYDWDGTDGLYIRNLEL